jgi:DNA-binding NtrC family response regulator
MGATTNFPIAVENAGALIASPSSLLREQVLDRIDGRWQRVQHVLGGADALAKLEQGSWQVLFLDRRLQDLDCEELIATVQRRFPGIQVVVLDSDAALPGSALATNSTNSKTDEDRAETPARSRQQDRPAIEARTGKAPRENGDAQPGDCLPLPGMIGKSEAMQQVYRLAQLVAPRTTTVLIVGPTGSGKELVARALHALSPRAAKPFVAVNCAAIPEALLESELFGHARGAFTGAVQAQVGRIPAAHGGTLFLDEVGELPLSMQAKLLRFLEEKEVQRLGSSEAMRVDVRVIAASNVDMAARAGRGEFREDLFYRLAGLSPGIAAAQRAPLRYRAPGRALPRVHVGRHERAMPAIERRSGADSGGPSLERQCARTAARDRAGIDSVGKLRHGARRAPVFPLSEFALTPACPDPFVRQPRQLREILAADRAPWQSPCKCCL